MAWPTKKRRTEEQNASEFWFIHFFVIECLEQSKGGKLHMKEIFEAYKKWKFKNRREKDGLKEINIITFGRLFPKEIKRTHLRINGVFAKGIRGYALDESCLKHPETKDGRVPLESGAV